jgi:hypothetical protein
MKYSLYKPTSYKDKNDPTSFAGSAISFNLWKLDEPTIILECVKQRSFDEKTKLASFYNIKENPEKGFRIKFNEKEAGGLIHAIRVYDKYDTFHDFDGNKTSISLSPMTKKPKNEGEQGQKAYTLFLKRNGSLNFQVGLELAEAEAIRVFLEVALVEMFWAANKFKGEKKASE